MKIKNKYIDNLKLKDFSFYGNPVEYALEDYDKVLGKIKNQAGKSKEILSVYTFGEVGVPGISDIDLIFVLKKGSKLPDLLKRKSVDKESEYLIFHPYLILTEDIMRNIRYIYPDSNYVKIYGKEIGIHSPSQSEIKKIKTYLIIDTILRHFPVDYLYILLSKRVNVRMVLLRFNALIHTFRMFNDISGINKRSWKEFSRKAGYLRKNWFALSGNLKEHKLFGLLKEAACISADFVKEFDAFLSKRRESIVQTGQGSVLFKGTKNRISFVKDWDVKKSMDELIEHFLVYRNFYSILPIGFLRHLCCYSSLDGRLSKYIRKRLSVECFQDDIEPVLKKRIQILNAQVAYANELKHSHYPCFFPLGYKTEKGLKNKIILLFVTITSSSVFRSILYYVRGAIRNITKSLFSSRQLLIMHACLL